MTRMRVALLTAGNPERVTGGYLFHRRMADRAADHDAELRFASVPEAPLPVALVAGPSWLRAAAIRQADVVVLDSIAAAAAAPWLGRLRRTVVGMLHQPPGGYGGSRVARAVRARFDRWAYRHVELLMVASEWLAEQLAADGTARSLLRVVPPGKDPAPGTDTAPGATQDTAASLRHDRGIALLCVANWLPHKGIIELLTAVASLPADLLTLHLVGDTAADPTYGRRIQARLQAPDLRDRVVVHGLVPATRVEQLYRSADAFALPSFEDSYGTAWGEAMAAGLPVVGFRAGNLPYLAVDGQEALIVPPTDIAALSAAIRSIATDPQLRQRLGEAAARRAAGRPTWDETATMFFAILADVGSRGR
jgi:glycosyltransferase involved in cell wall biosynthesis